MDNIQIRKMTYDDIPLICKADHDESAGFVEYLRNNLDNQGNKKCSALLALYGGEVAGYVFLYVTLATKSLFFSSGYISDSIIELSCLYAISSVFFSRISL